MCSKCKAENPETKKFCHKHGAKLSLTSPQRGAEILPGYDLLRECDGDLREPQKAPPIGYNRPQSYTPKFLADKVFNNRSAIEGERKLLTVLFC